MEEAAALGIDPEKTLGEKEWIDMDSSDKEKWLIRAMGEKVVDGATDKGAFTQAAAAERTKEKKPKMSLSKRLRALEAHESRRIRLSWAREKILPMAFDFPF